MAASKKPTEQARPLTTRQKMDALGIEALCSFIVSNSAEGNLNRFCLKHDLCYGSVVNWLRADPSRIEQYAGAREDRADILADEIVSIADEDCVTLQEPRNDGEVAKLVMDATAVARNKLRIDARKWAASKLKPKSYSDKLAIGGAEDLPPIRSNVSIAPDEAYKAMLGDRSVK